MSLTKIFISFIFIFTILFTYSRDSKVSNDDTQNVHVINHTQAVDRERIREHIKQEAFDVLIVGGGATGAAVALDATNRGLKVALIERSDFGSGTSSKSTKLLHGGVRYLEKAVFNLDWAQYSLVTEALNERGDLMTMAPHLTHPLEIITPLYHWWEIPYYWMGLKVYDWISGAASLNKSEYILPSTLVGEIPTIKTENLVGGVSYYDGQFNDTRLNISFILSANGLGATVLNYAEVVNLNHDPLNGRVIGVRALDTINGEHFDIHAKVIVNATGPYADALRLMDNGNASPLIAASSGTHLILAKDLIPNKAGLLIPKTKDGRVIFMLPWQGNTLVGTTDNPTTVTNDPHPIQEDVTYLLDYVSEYLDVTLTPSDVKSAWTGIRPLVQSPDAKDTASLVRDHYIEVSPSGLLTITGGKWTTCRKMGEDVVDRIAEQLNKIAPHSSTTSLRLIGFEGYDSNLSNKLVEQFGVSAEIAEHLVSSYGGKAQDILMVGRTQGLNYPLAVGYPIIAAEIQWALSEEMAQKPMDILSRRTRLATLDSNAAKLALPQVIDMMQQHFNWTSSQAAEMKLEAMNQINLSDTQEIYHNFAG